MTEEKTTGMSKVILSPSVLNSKLSITLDPIKHASHLPIFDGCRDQLKSFTDMVDVMVPILQDYDTSSQIIVSNIIKSRIVGKAKQILDSSPHITKWEEIKKILYANFSDQRNSSQLLNELRSTEFRGSIIDYINLIQKRLTNLNLKVEQEQKFNFVRIIQDNHTIALEVLKNNMPEPVRTILFCRNPTSIENVIFILSETGHLYQKKESNIPKNRSTNRNFKQGFQNLPNQSLQSGNYQHHNVHTQNNYPFHQNQYGSQHYHNQSWKNQNFNPSFPNYDQHRFNQNSVQSRIRRFGPPQPMEVDGSRQVINTNQQGNFRKPASENPQTSIFHILE